MPTAIKFENISKQYRLGVVSTQTLSHDLNRWWKMNIRGKEDPYLKIGEVNDRAHKGESEYVWALKDINFEVQQGDVLGIIGKNGAGKSTLLKILSKVTAPTTGTIKAAGRIASLLEVGTGFHPEMTGRENIYMNGAIMGMTKAEITRRFDEIVDFSGVERYIDTPAKRYSSGMTVRLGFAIAAHLEPEILVVDEVLAVGDAEFQKKAIGKMQDVSRGEGRTVLFVSHNMGALKNLCKKGIILNNGGVLFEGTANEAVSRYLNLNQLEKIYNSTKTSGFYVKKAYTVNYEMVNSACYEINENPKLLIEIFQLIKNESVANAILGVVLLDDLKNKIFTVEYNLINAFTQIDTTEVKLLVELPNRLLAPGNYSFLIAIHNPNVELFDEVDDICGFNIIEDDTIGHFKYSSINQGSIIVDSNFKLL
jgi:lipopolysaccharide transport system ATP-binding protein